jgi:hypothetical protein
VAGVIGFELRNGAANYPFESSHRFPGISRILASETVTGNDTETLVFLTYAPPPPPEPAALFVDPSEPFPPTPMSSFEELKSPGCVVPAVRKTIVAALADGAKKQTEIRQRCRNAKRNGAPRNVPQFNYFFLASIVCRYCTAQFCEGKILKEHNSRRRKKDADRCGDGTSERSSAWTGRRRRRFADAEIRSYRATCG